MRDDECRVDPAGLNVLEQRPEVAMDMTLAGLDCKRPVHDGVHWELVDEASVNTDDGHRSAAGARQDGLTQRNRTVRLHPHHLLHSIVHVEHAMAMPLHSDGVNAMVR